MNEEKAPRRGAFLFLFGCKTVGADIIRPVCELFAHLETERRERRSLRSRSRLDMTARRCDLSCENLCGAAGAAVRSSVPSSVSLASCETHFARFCRETPPDERSLRSAASGGRSEQGTAPRSKISRRMPPKFLGTARETFAVANRRGRSPLSLAVTTVSFRRKRWG